MPTYKIVRKYLRNTPDEVLATGLTLEQAQAHCQDPETSSKTATNAAGQPLADTVGPWFDAYYEEPGTEA
jgi:hypothetical protein